MQLTLCLLVNAAAAQSDLLLQGDQHVSQGRWDQARRAYEQARAAGADLEHDYSRARNLGSAYLRSSTPDLAQAARWLRAALQLRPEADDTRLLLAETLAQSGDYGPAIEQFQALVRSHPDSSEYVLSLARTMHLAAKPEASLPYLAAYLQRDPGNNAVRLEYARMLGFSRKYPEAMREYETVLKSEPQNLAAQVGVARVASWQKQLDRALELYDRILARHPTLWDARVGKAFTLMWLGRSGEARALFTELAQLRPDDLEVRDALTSLGGTPPENTTSQTPPEAQPQETLPLPPSPQRPVLQQAPPPMSSEAPDGQAEQPAKPASQRLKSDKGNHGASPQPQHSADSGNAAATADAGRNETGVAGQREQEQPQILGATAYLAPILVLLAGAILFWQARRTVQLARALTKEDSPRLLLARRRETETEKLLSGQVLIVHPDPALCEYVCSVLGTAGANVEAAENIAVALGWLENVECDAVIVSEQQVGGRPATDLFLWLKSRRPATELVLVTDDASSQTATLLQRGGALVLLEPFSASDVLAMTRLALGRRSVAV